MARAHARCDVLVIGSGGAGMCATLSAAQAGASTMVVTKSRLGASNTSRAQGGIQAAIGFDDSIESHLEDTLEAGHNDARPELVRTLTAAGPEAIEWLDMIGVEFSRDDGEL
ncbi:MAG: FAD-dependent oxidoreductase, partial [Thermoleophilia bacterium]|nr:FAD-dependent oxidoreductase [Thermoleophilia bacterium]